MKRYPMTICLILLFAGFRSNLAQTYPLWGQLKPGPFAVGFQLIQAHDYSRIFNTNVLIHSQKNGEHTRPMRVYIWYPARTKTATCLSFQSFLKMAAEDFGPLDSNSKTDRERLPKPVQLEKGMGKESIERLMKKLTASVLDAKPQSGAFPLIVFGQGFYYESPLTHLVLCEFLASHGYVVTTCPLIGTHYRLVNLNMVDLETQIRDMEFAISRVRVLPFVHPDQLGVIGYDMDGMAGVTLSMRNLEVDAFVSLDAGILFGHPSALPGSHPHYSEEKFQIPWMHVTQARFLSFARSQGAVSSSMDRKQYGDSYLFLVNTEIHSEFTSYAMFGIENPVTAYWGPIEKDPQPLYKAICGYCLFFLDGYIKGDKKSLSRLQENPQDYGLADIFVSIERKNGDEPPPSKDDLVNLIIKQGTTEAMPIIQKAIEELITFERLSDRVLIVKMGQVYPDQVVAIASEKGLVLIDSGISPTISKKYRDIIEREFGRNDFAYVVNTHHHFDHTNGNQVFSDAVIVAHENCPERMREFIEGIPDFIQARRERYIRRWKLAQSLDSSSDMYKRLRDLFIMSDYMCNDLEGNFKLALPTMTFRERLTIDLGDMTLKLLYFGSGLHTDNDIIVTIPEEGLIFTGDLFRDFQTTAGVTSDGELKNWIVALDSILQDSEELKHVVTIHAGLLQPERLINTRDSFKNLLNEMRGKTSAAAFLEQQIAHLGVRAAVDQFRKMGSNEKKRYYVLEGDFIELGYRLLSQDKIDGAVAVFELNAEMFPQSLDTNDCLGEAYMTAGNKERAVKVFRRSLEMYPLNSYAFDMIHMLQSKNQD